MGLKGQAVRAYYAKARIRENPELIATIRWYAAPPGAQVFPGDHAFGSNVWEFLLWDTPRTGLGFVDFNFAQTDRGEPPEGVCGCGTPTPLDWFVNGVPAGITGPNPNGPCPSVGEAFTIPFCFDMANQTN